MHQAYGADPLEMLKYFCGTRNEIRSSEVASPLVASKMDSQEFGMLHLSIKGFWNPRGYSRYRDQA